MEMFVNSLLQDVKFGLLMELLHHVILVIMDSTKMVILVLNVLIFAILVLLPLLVVLAY